MTQAQFEIPALFDYFATFLWAVSGAIVGMHKRYDFAGALVVALVASTGGSLLRDGLFLQQTPPVLSNQWYIPIILLATLLVSLFRRRISRMGLVDRTISMIDAVGVPAFALIGMQLSFAAGIPPPGVVLVGVVNGVGGGLLRDILVDDTPAALVPGQFYVSAAIFVCILFVILVQGFEVNKDIAGWIVIATFFTVRMLSIRYNWRTKPILPDSPSS